MPFSSSNSISLLDFAQTFQGKKVWVTGHTGFKGSWLCEWLLQLGARVSGFSLPQPSTTPSLFDQLGLAARMDDRRGDIRDRELVKKTLLEVDPDFVFHLAAQPIVRLSYRTPVETWETNVLGTIHVLEALRALQAVRASGVSARLPADNAHSIASSGAAASPHANRVATVAVMITTDKVYENREWLHGYREVDPLGGHDPYSSSKAASEMAIASWRASFFQDHSVRIASARAGNVIGGGDWAQDRIVPDLVRALQAGRPVPVRNKNATRPWQHVLEPLSGYLLLAARLSGVEQGESGHRGALAESATQDSPSLASVSVRSQEPNTSDPRCSAFNFGPHLESNRTVKDLVEQALKHWPGRWEDQSDPQAPHEAGKLNLVWDKAHHLLGWSPRWGFAKTVEKTIAWYRAAAEGADPAELTRRQIAEYSQS
jgi:CDP-glucose 4,6-dehydratase